MQGQGQRALEISFMLKIWLCFFSLGFAFYGNADDDTCSRLVRTLIKSGGINDLLVERGVDSAAARRAENYVHKASMELVHLYEFEALTSGSFRRHLSRSLENVTPQDTYIKQRVFGLLDVDVRLVSRDELVGLVNNLMYLGNRYGHSLDNIRPACRNCVDENFYDSGFRFVFRESEISRRERVYRYMETMFPRRLRSRPWEVDERIRAWMHRLELGHFSPLLVYPEDRKTLAFFFGDGPARFSRYKGATGVDSGHSGSFPQAPRRGLFVGPRKFPQFVENL